MLRLDSSKLDELKGEFEIQIDNAVKAPTFVYGVTKNKEWEDIRNYAPPWSVLRLPGQFQVFIETRYKQYNGQYLLGPMRSFQLLLKRSYRFD